MAAMLVLLPIADIKLQRWRVDAYVRFYGNLSIISNVITKKKKFWEQLIACFS
jgi:hypothetical protein